MLTYQDFKTCTSISIVSESYLDFTTSIFKMFTLGGLIFLLIAANADNCDEDSDCRDGKVCRDNQVGPNCETVRQCNLPGQWDYQNCQCTHVKAGLCMDKDKSSSSCYSGSWVEGICPTRDGMTWECCENITEKRCINRNGYCATLEAGKFCPSGEVGVVDVCPSGDTCCIKEV